MIRRGQSPVQLAAIGGQFRIGQRAGPAGKGHDRQQAIAQISELLGEDTRAQEQLWGTDLPCCAVQDPAATAVALQALDR
ncbi:hypothetical protein D9M68_865400 [compost metagenome]